MKYFLILLLSVGCLFMGSCAFLDYVRNETGKYAEEIEWLSEEKTALEKLQKDLVEKLKSRDIKPKEIIALSVKLTLTTQKILEISNNIADKREEERKKGVPWWWSLVNFTITAITGGGFGAALVKLIPGRRLGFKETE